MRINIQRDLYWSFSYFLIIIILGFYMRLTQALPDVFSYNYRHILHTHSHIAMLGWVYITLTSLMSYVFIPVEKQQQHRRIFYFTQLTLLGMLFSFPFEGYGVVSITFSVLFVFSSYFYGYFFLKNSNTKEHKQLISYRFARMGIFYLLLSSLGIWAIPLAIAIAGKNSDLYQTAIAFFLNFQYDGWILTALMGLIIKKIQGDKVPSKLTNRIFYGFQVGVFGSFAISLLRIFDYSVLHIIGGITSLIWLFSVLAISYLYIKKYPFKNILSNGFIFLFVAKVYMMLFASIPYFKEFIFYNNDLIISYLHFNFLGIINFGLLYLLDRYGLFTPSQISIYLYVGAFFITELLIAYKGISLWFGWFYFDNFFLFINIVNGFFLIAVGEWIFRISRK